MPIHMMAAVAKAAIGGGRWYLWVPKRLAVRVHTYTQLVREQPHVLIRFRALANVVHNGFEELRCYSGCTVFAVYLGSPLL